MHLIMFFGKEKVYIVTIPVHIAIGSKFMTTPLKIALLKIPWNRMGLIVIKPHISKVSSEGRGKITVLLLTCLTVDEVWRLW